VADETLRERAWAAHLSTKRNRRQARRGSFDAGWDAAQAAVTDAPGPEEALVAHRLNFDIDGGEECQDDDWDGSGAYETHLAAVVRAWLRGDGA